MVGGQASRRARYKRLKADCKVRGICYQCRVRKGVGGRRCNVCCGKDVIRNRLKKKLFKVVNK